MITHNETLNFWNEDGREHRIELEFNSNKFNAYLTAIYITGTCDIQPGTTVVEWCASYEPPNQFDDGHAAIGDGRIDLEVEALRGIGLGSLLMQPLIHWIKKHPDVPMVPINLAADDATTIEVRNRRNRFYEKLGFEFDYKDDQSWGESKPLQSIDLVNAQFKLSKGWHINYYQSEIFNSLI